jgi:hypothetical protein
MNVTGAEFYYTADAQAEGVAESSLGVADAEAEGVEESSLGVADAEVEGVEESSHGVLGMLHVADATYRERSKVKLASSLRFVEEEFAANNFTAVFSDMSMHEKLVVGYLMKPLTPVEEQFGGKLGTEIARILAGNHHCLAYGDILRTIEDLVEKSLIYIVDETRFGFCFTRQA